jgi:NAD(P)-dependent dehydrogenase (short-subunit alcohol dehydrogenase family)
VLGLVGAEMARRLCGDQVRHGGADRRAADRNAGTGIDVILIEPGPITSRIRENADPAFRKMDRLGSLGPAEEYRGLLHRLYDKPRPSRTVLNCRLCGDGKADPCAGKPRPRARYYVTTPTHLMGLARRLLPTARWTG